MSLKINTWMCAGKKNYTTSVRIEDKGWFTFYLWSLSSHDKIHSLMATILGGLSRKAKDRLSSEV